MDSLSQLKSLGVVASVAEAATRPTRRRAGAGSGAWCARPATVVACWDWSGGEALEIRRTGVAGGMAAAWGQRGTSAESGAGSKMTTVGSAVGAVPGGDIAFWGRV